MSFQKALLNAKRKHGLASSTVEQPGVHSIIDAAIAAENKETQAVPLETATVVNGHEGGGLINASTPSSPIMVSGPPVRSSSLTQIRRNESEQAEELTSERHTSETLHVVTKPPTDEDDEEKRVGNKDEDETSLSDSAPASASKINKEPRSSGDTTASSAPPLVQRPPLNAFSLLLGTKRPRGSEPPLPAETSCVSTDAHGTRKETTASHVRNLISRYQSGARKI